MGSNVSCGCSSSKTCPQPGWANHTIFTTACCHRDDEVVIYLTNGLLVIFKFCYSPDFMLSKIRELFRVFHTVLHRRCYRMAMGKWAVRVFRCLAIKCSIIVKHGYCGQSFACSDMTLVLQNVFLSPDAREVRPCTVNNGECEHFCNDSTGQVVCSCFTGFSLDANTKTCSGELSETDNWFTNLV